MLNWLNVYSKKIRGSMRYALAFAMILACGVGSVDAASSQFCGKADQAMEYVNNAMAQIPALANNPEAQKVYMAIVALESSFNTQAAGKYNGRAVSFGLGQVNYYSHQKAVDATIKASGGPDLSGMSYEQKLPIAGQWLLDNPQQATNLGAQVFADAIKANGGDLAKAASSYCGGCEAASRYNEIINENLSLLASCGDGTSIVLTTVGGTPTVLRCPDADLAKALDQANMYYNGLAANAMRQATDATVETANKTWGDFETPFGPVKTRLCLDKIIGFYQLISSLLGKGAGIMNMLINWINQLLNTACQYVIATINNALNSVCIPMPDMPSLPGFGGPDRKACNGYSMADLISFTVNAPSLPTVSGSELNTFFKNNTNKMPGYLSRGARQ